MIDALKPDVLERFIVGKPPVQTFVPMGGGRPPMPFLDYINSAQELEARNGTITPKVHLNAIWSDQYRLQSALQLYALPLKRRLRWLSLDQYFTGGTPAANRSVLETFLAMGWRGLGFNFAGGANDTFGLATYAMAGINTTSWNVSLRALDVMKADGIPIRLAHVDYPAGINAFATLTPDQQAVIIQRLSRDQYLLHFSLVYPVLYGNLYDSTAEITRSDGPFHGASVFEIIKDEIHCDRLYPAPCVRRFPRSTF